MSSLWTPDGERRVRPADEPSCVPRMRLERDLGGTAQAGGDPRDPASGGRAGSDQAMAEQMRRLEARLLDTPIEDVIANHCYGFFQLAALHLGQRPPGLESARLAIDALAAVVETLGDRLEDAAPTLRDGLAQIRLAYVQIAGARRLERRERRGPRAAEPTSRGPAARPRRAPGFAAAS